MPRNDSVGPELIAFGRMVVNDVEDDFDAGRMHGLHHGLEFVDRPGREIPRLGREKTDRVISPVIPQALLHQCAVIDEVMHGHQFNGGDSQFEQMIDHRGGRQSGISAAKMRGNIADAEW